ncbi:hypothetical protein ACIBKX_08815 [Streptomyces sp. NPDC050658]|uniref:hypothetical protein n=1 Tax=unclassified Streptomyces TaxID=2593676 RepID=UPI0034169FD6
MPATRTIALAALTTAVALALTGCGSGATDAAPKGTTRADAKKSGPKAPADWTGEPLSTAKEELRAAGGQWTATAHDAGDQKRGVFADSGWTVCFQTTGRAQYTDAGEIDFGVVKTGEPCPAEDGAALPWPTMPDVHDQTWIKALAMLKTAEITNPDPDMPRIEADTYYSNEELPDEGAYDQWKVCAPDPQTGAKVPADQDVTLYLVNPADTCPAAAKVRDLYDESHALRGERLPELPDADNDGDPDRRDPAPSDPDRNSTFPDGAGGSGGSGSGGSTGGSSSGSSGGGRGGKWWH